MNELTLPPSPNWYLSNILACASDNTIAWGSRNVIVIAKPKEASKTLDFSIIDRAHTEKVSCLSFSPNPDETGFHRLVSGGEDNIVQIWGSQDLKMKMKNSTLNSGQKVVGVDWSKHNTSLVCFTSEDGVLVIWNVNYDASQVIALGRKLTATCLSCCPHDCNLVAIGFKNGIVYLVDLRGSGSITYKLSSHDSEIVSLSWCPVPVNIFESKETKEFLLATGSKDRNIFLWKAGTDGRYQIKLTHLTVPLDTSNHKSKLNNGTGNHTVVCWLEPTTLLTSSPWGELLIWDLNGSTKKKFTPKLIHAKHGRGLFAIAGLVNTSAELIEDNESENWRTKTNIKAIWTLAQDRQIVCCSLLDNETIIEYDIPTQGGFVYCISACPVDTSQTAFGVGDAMIRLWNLSEPHETTIEMQMLWEKIKGKVRAIAWHPEKENVLAFATNEGRIGTFDTNLKRNPILYRQYHRHIVYSIGWGPAPNIREYALYTCGDGELVYYNPEKPDDHPKPVIKKKDCTEFCWKPDYSILAIGFGNGSISFLNRDLQEYGSTINLLHKSIQCLTWHPESTLSDLNISTMQNYLAVSVNGSFVNVFDILCNPEENKTDQSPFYKTVATLHGHSEKVVCLSWSPHISGYLVSGSYDNTAQVWKIETQEVIATYTSHLGPIQCCMWSPFSQDFIITGSADFTLRIWSISKQTVISPSFKSSTRGKRLHQCTKKKAAKKEESFTASNVNGKKLAVDGETIIAAAEKNEKMNPEPNFHETEIAKNNVQKFMKRKKPKKVTYFPGYAEVVHNSKLWCQSVRKLKDSIECNILDNESGVFVCNEAEPSPTNKGCNNTNLIGTEVPVLLGSKKNLEETLSREKKILEANGQLNVVTEIDIWSGNLKKNLEESLKNKTLSDHLVSLALIETSISTEMRDKIVHGYINQLISEDNPSKAVSYLLCINKVSEAIDIYMSLKMYKEAYSIATLKLTANDPVIKNVLREWANNAVKDGNFKSATECYIMLGDYVKAVKILERRKDIDSLILAIELAEVVKDLDLITSVADKAILEALFVSEFKIAKTIVNNHPQMQFREIEIEIYSIINKMLESINDETIFNWLKSSSSTNLLETIHDRFAKCPEKYSILLHKDVYPLTDCQNEKIIQINVSHQIALYILSDSQEQQLQHIVKACDIISQYEKVNTEQCKSLLLKYLCILENKNLTNASNIFNITKNGVSQSLRAYLCYAIINWFHENQLKKELVSECIDMIVPIVEKYVEDLLNHESINFWTITNEINKLESQLSSPIGQMSNSTENDSTDISALIEKLDKLKKSKKEFLDKRISSPNPLFSYGAIMEFLSKVSDEQKCQKLTDLVMSTWKNAIS